MSLISTLPTYFTQFPHSSVHTAARIKIFTYPCPPFSSRVFKVIKESPRRKFCAYVSNEANADPFRQIMENPINVYNIIMQLDYCIMTAIKYIIMDIKANTIRKYF